MVPANRKLLRSYYLEERRMLPFYSDTSDIV